MPVSTTSIASSVADIETAEFFKKAFAAQQTVTFAPTEALINAKVSDSYTKTALQSLINNLKAFSQCMSNSAYDPVIFGTKDETIKPPDTNSHHYAGDLISTQTELDLARINAIITQRQDGSLVADFLKKMDAKALEMIQWAVERSLFHPSFDYQPNLEVYNAHDHVEPCPLPLVFFGGNETSRTVPYTPVAPLALPTELMNMALASSSLTVSGFNDFYHLWIEPMLAYQVGLLIFWKGDMVDTSQIIASVKFARFLNLQMQDEGCSEWVSNAVAGIFADVFAAMWCNNSAVGYAIRRATSKRNESYLAEDMRYQLPWFLRPYVTLETLRLMTGEAADYTELKDLWKKKEKELHYTRVREYSLYAAWDPNLDNICKLPEISVIPKEVTVYSAGKSFNLSFNAALAEVIESTGEIYKLLSSLPVSPLATALSLPVSVPTLWLDGAIWDTPHQQGLVPANPGKNYFIEVWFCALSVQTRDRIQKAADKGVIPGYVYETYYHNQKVYWTTLLYSGGWMLESSGNSGGPH